MLIFQLWNQPEQRLNIISDRALQIELVTRNAQRDATPAPKNQPSLNNTEQRAKPAAAPQAEIVVHQPSNHKTEQTVAAVPSKPVAKPETFKAEAEPASADRAATEPDSVAAMPAEVLSMVLSRITYPRQARRKGWQGDATFRLAVHEQKLARLDLAHSSGHHLLDHSAMRDIRGIDHLPLANGTYRLPVTFRLQ